MGRKERRKLEKKIKHLQKTKPWELQALIREEYDRATIDSRLNNDVLAPGDKVMLDVKKMMTDPDWDKYKPEYKNYVLSHASEVFTLRKEAKQDKAFTLVSFEEDDTQPRWMHFIGHVKKVKSN